MTNVDVEKICVYYSKDCIYIESFSFVEVVAGGEVKDTISRKIFLFFSLHRHQKCINITY